MRVARAVVEGDGWREPRFLRREGGGCGFDGLVACWVPLGGGGRGGERGAESRLVGRWAWAEARVWPVAVWLDFGALVVVVVIFGVEGP